MNGRIECHYQGHDFTAGEMVLLRALIAGPPPLSRHALSREFCRRIGWFKPDGGLKDMTARVAMLAMHNDGLITLPPQKWRKAPPRPIIFGQDTEVPLLPAPTTLDEVRPLELRTVVRATREGRLWNEFVARYHYLGYKPLVGAQMRYAVHEGYPPGVSPSDLSRRACTAIRLGTNPSDRSETCQLAKASRRGSPTFQGCGAANRHHAVSARLGYPARVAYAVTPTLPNVGTGELSSSQREKTWTPGASHHAATPPGSWTPASAIAAKLERLGSDETMEDER